jgi:hypothetical protein
MSDVLKNPKRNRQEIKKNIYIPEYKKYGIIPNNFAESKVIVIPNSKKNFNNKLDKVISTNNTLPQLFTSNKMQNNKDYVDPYDSEIEFSTSETDIKGNMSGSNNLSEADGSDINDSDDDAENDSGYDSDLNSDLNHTDDSGSLNEDDSDKCILIVDNNIISISSFEDTQSQVESLIFGTHPKFNKLIQAENIKVYRRLTIKVGVFLE